MLVGIAAALAAACCYSGGSLGQAVGARRAARRAHARTTARDFLRQPTYLIGLGLDLGGWILSIVALAFLPLFVQQVFLASSLGITALLARFVLKVHLRHIDLVAIAVAALGLAVLGLAAAAEDTTPPTFAVRMGLLASAPVLAFAGLAASRRRRPIVTGSVGGLCFAASAIAARTVEEEHIVRHLGRLLSEPVTWSIPVFGLLGVALYGRALERGSVGPVTASLWVVEIVPATIVGVSLLGDSIRRGWALPAIAAMAVAIGSIVVLAMSPVHAASPDV